MQTRWQRPPRKFSLIGPHVHLIAKHEISGKRARRLIPRSRFLHKKILIQILSVPNAEEFNSETCPINIHEECNNLPFL